MQLKWPMLWDLFSLFPAHAGVILCQLPPLVDSLAFPRTRGGDPLLLLIYGFITTFSPHTRG